MLVDLTVGAKDSGLGQILRLIGEAGPTRIETGVYTGGLNQEKFFLEELDGWFHDDRRSSYGVCDDLDQVKALFADMIDGPDPIAITLTPIVKSEQPPDGGWRWHKWGEYIGTKEPQCEYLHDEGPEFDTVYVYHVYKVKG